MVTHIRIKDRKVGPGHPCFIIAIAGYACLVFVSSQKVCQVEYYGRKIVSMVIMFLLCLAIGFAIRLEEYLLVVMGLKALIALGFAVFLWKSGIVWIRSLSILDRKTNKDYSG